MIKTDEFDFELPSELIAQFPSPRRSESRLMVLRREPFEIQHLRFRDIVKFFNPGDVLVLNKSKVIKARIFGRRAGTGGKVELLVTEIRDENLFSALVKPGRKARVGEIIVLEGGAEARVLEKFEDGSRLFEVSGKILEILDKYGHVPLPPYIRREDTPLDEKRYQTVFAEVPGSIAAPTAGLHFEEPILEALREKGVEIKFIILHVGLGTFKPIKTETVEEHRMDREYFEIPEDTREALNEARARGSRIFGCGTTVTRSLETWKFGKGPSQGYTDLFIYPGFKFDVIDALITNFHLPRSTPILLVSAFAGWDKIKKAYEEAIRLRYRFFSYGDAMLII